VIHEDPAAEMLGYLRESIVDTVLDKQRPVVTLVCLPLGYLGSGEPLS